MTATKQAEAVAALFALGPQDDGSIIIRLPDEYHRVIGQKAMEKQFKNAASAEGTMSALADGADPFLVRVRNALEKLQQIFVGARPASNQLDNTPMGEALKASSTDASGGLVWADDVPTPRPKIGELVRWPTGQSESISAIAGYDSTSRAFVAESEDSKFSGIVKHPTTPGEWALLSLLLDYDTELPDEPNRAQEIGNGESQQEGREQSQGDAQTETGAPPATKPAGSQRARNAAHNGVKRSTTSPTKPAPKPSGKKGSGKKGGK